MAALLFLLSRISGCWAQAPSRLTLRESVADTGSYAALTAQQPPTPDSLEGLWASTVAASPQIRGVLTVTRRPEGWSASVHGTAVPFQPHGDSIRFILPGNQGEFRGRVADGGSAIAGFWIQPAGVVIGAPYASPLLLMRVGPAIWRGSVVPLEDRFTLYARIERQPDGRLVAVFRNPEANIRGGAARLDVQRAVDSIRFTDPSSGSVQVQGTYDVTGHRLVLQYPPLSKPVILTPQRPERSAFYPRGLHARYRYRTPETLDDGWKTARAAAVGIDEARLTGLVQALSDTDPAAPGAPLIHSILVARHGRMVLEEYFLGFDRAQPHDLRSVSKIFGSVMLGAAIDRGLLPGGADTPVYRLLGYDSVANPDPRKSRITLAHLLTHSTGLACDDNGADLPGNENVMQSQQAQPDWYKYTLDLPLLHDPGQVYAYCSGTMNLVGGALHSVTRLWLPEAFRRYVAVPLGISRFYMNLMPGGDGYAGGGMFLLPRDLLKLGQVHLDGGVWNGHRVMSLRWVAQSTAWHIAAPDSSSDGYGWHRHTLRHAAHVYQEYEANGNGGQFLIVVPAFDLVVVFTAGNYNSYGIWRRFRDQLVADQIIAAVHE